MQDCSVFAKVKVDAEFTPDLGVGHMQCSKGQWYSRVFGSYEGTYTSDGRKFQAREA